MQIVLDLAARPIIEAAFQRFSSQGELELILSAWTATTWISAWNSSAQRGDLMIKSKR
jgi:hypothetical protein